MTFQFPSELKPFYAELLNQDACKFFLSDRFENTCLRLDLDEEWKNLITEQNSNERFFSEKKYYNELIKVFLNFCWRKKQSSFKFICEALVSDLSSWKYPDLISLSVMKAAKATVERSSLSQIIRGIRNPDLIDSFPELNISNKGVQVAINDFKILVIKNGSASGIDRLHTILYGYFLIVCQKENIDTTDVDSLTDCYKKLRKYHSVLKEDCNGSIQINNIISCSLKTIKSLIVVIV